MLNQDRKICVLSLHRNATQSIDKFFKLYGLNSLHWGGWEVKEDENIKNLDIDKILEKFYPIINKYDCLVDHPFNLMYEYINENYYDSKFILITRPIDSWINSVNTLCSFRKNNQLYLYESLQYEKYLNFRPKSLNDLSNEQRIFVYESHTKLIKKYFNNKKNFLEIEINNIKNGDLILNFLNLNKNENIEFPNIDASRIIKIST